MILYHVKLDNPSEGKLDGRVTLDPAIPESMGLKEDNKVKRVCFSTSIAGCLGSIGVSPYIS